MFLCAVSERSGGSVVTAPAREWYRSGDEDESDAGDVAAPTATATRTVEHRQEYSTDSLAERTSQIRESSRVENGGGDRSAPVVMTIHGKAGQISQGSWEVDKINYGPLKDFSGTGQGGSPVDTSNMDDHGVYYSRQSPPFCPSRAYIQQSPTDDNMYTQTNYHQDFTNNNYTNSNQDYSKMKNNVYFDESQHIPTRVNGFCGLYQSAALSRSLDGCLDGWSQEPTYVDHRRPEGLVDYSNGPTRSRRTGSTSSDQSLDGEGSTASGGGSTGSGQSHPGGYYTLPSTPTNVNGALDFPRGCDAESMGRILDFHRTLAKYYTQGQRASEPLTSFPSERRRSVETNASSDSNEAVPPPTLRGRAQSEDLGLSLSTLQIKSILRQNSTQNGSSKANHSAPTTPVHAPNNSQPRTPKLIKFNLSTISEFQTIRRSASSEDDLQDIPLLRQRSMSACEGALGINRCASLSDDDDPGDDDYGFLSYPGLISTFPPTAMQKTKTPVSIAMTTGHRILPKKWRKTKLLSGASTKYVSTWKHEAACTWCSPSGSKLVLSSTNLIHLTDIERLALQKIALARLQALDLGCTIAIPKDGSTQKRSKRSAFSLKRKTESASSGWVFGIPLSKCVANDIELRRRRPSFLQERRESVSTRKSSSSSVASSVLQPIHVAGQRSHSVVYDIQALVPNRMDAALHSINQHHAGGLSSDSFSESDSRSIGSNLLDALSLSSSAKPRSRNMRPEQRDPLTPHSPQVPYIVNSCCKYLENYGVHILGIFRIGSSKKRVKQLREEFDSAKDVKFNEEHSPHDVGALLKEFFRDLPDPLLTRDLYSAFVATRKIQTSDRRRAALHHLVSLLPVPNRDTLWSLLKFLNQVAQHSTDQIDEQGLTIPGNKMDSHNLATLFGPNILHKAKGGEFEVETMERAEERKEVIAVVQELIEQSHTIYELSGDLHDEVLQAIHETNPEGFDLLLKRKTAAMGMESEVETSSSYYEPDSDASSIPRTPSYASPESDSHPHSLSEALAMQARQSAHPDSSPRKIRPEDPPLDTLKVPQFRIISPNHGPWYRPDSRSPSPVSPRISPSPKAMKPGVPDLRIRIAPDSLGDDRNNAPSMSAQALISPRPTRYRRQLIPTISNQSSIPSSHPASHRDTNTLTVPNQSRKTMHESDSCSSLSSYYPMSSRSGTASPMTPDPPNSPRGWYPETPPRTPSQEPPSSSFDSEKDTRSSSLLRPLGVNSRRSRSKDREHPSLEWQKERWKHWENLAKERGDEFHEQETLV